MLEKVGKSDREKKGSDRCLAAPALAQKSRKALLFFNTVTMSRKIRLSSFEKALEQGIAHRILFLRGGTPIGKKTVCTKPFSTTVSKEVQRKFLHAIL